MEEVYTEIKVLSSLKTFVVDSWCQGAPGSSLWLCDRSRIQPPASQSNTSHKDITYDLINILVKEFSLCGSVTKSAEM